MRLECLERGKNLRQRVAFWMMRRYLHNVPGPILTMSYKPENYGHPIARCFEEAMRESTEWSIGETELLSAFVSLQNQCHF